jgi:hypothetical protein
LDVPVSYSTSNFIPKKKNEASKRTGQATTSRYEILDRNYGAMVLLFLVGPNQHNIIEYFILTEIPSPRDKVFVT